MSDSAIASDFLQLLNVECGISSEITLNRVLTVDNGGNSLNLFIGQVTNTRVRIDFSLGNSNNNV